MSFVNFELDLTEDEKLRLICAAFSISDDLLADIKAEHDDPDQRIVNLVLSAAANRALAAIVAEAEAEAEAEEDNPEN